MKTDKRTSNLFIAAGYFLVAIVILFNYLGQTLKKEQTSIAAPVARSAAFDFKAGIQPQQSQPNLDALTRQLNEEKRVNLEMREMIRQLQNSFHTESGGEATAQNVFSSENTLELPSIRTDIENELKRKRTNPFIPDKNPFAPARKFEELAGRKNLEPYIGKALICNPRLPFFISGANSSSSFSANF